MFEWLDVGLLLIVTHVEINLSDCPSQRRVEEVLQIVVSATRELFGDVGPPVAHLILQLEQFVDLGLGELLVLDDRRVEMVVPPE